MWRFEIYINIMRLTFDPVRGRKTFYGKITIGRNTWWLQRWDVARLVGDQLHMVSRDGRMAWTCGNRTQ